MPSKKEKLSCRLGGRLAPENERIMVKDMELVFKPTYPARTQASLENIVNLPNSSHFSKTGKLLTTRPKCPANRMIGKTRTQSPVQRSHFQELMDGLMKKQVH